MKQYLQASLLFFILLCSAELIADKGTNFLNQGNTAFLKGDLMDAMKLYSQAERSCVDMVDKIENNKALVFATRGKYNLAINRLTKALDHNPNNGNAYYNRGIVYIIIENYQAATADLSQAKFLNTSTAKSIDFNIALAYYLNGDISGARTSLSNASIENQDARVPYLSGLISYGFGEFDRASQAFAKAYLLDQNDHIKYAHGLATYYEGNQEQGLSILEELKDKDEFMSDYNLLLADLAYEANDMETAKSYYMDALKKNKKDAAAWLGIGNIAVYENDINEASKNFQNAVKYDHKNVTALNGLAELEFKSGRHKSAILFYDKALTIAPTDHKALYGKALAAMKIPDPYTCLDELAKIKKQNLSKDQIEKVIILEASALGICNKKEQAITLLQKYRRIAQDKNKIKTLLGYYYLRMFKYSNAISSIGISKYDNYEPYLIAGHASLHRGKHSSAYSYYRKAYKIAPKNPDVLMGAALCMIEIGMKKEAKRVIDSLEVLYPDNFQVFNSKGIIYKDLGMGYQKKKQKQQADAHLKIAAKAFERAIEIRPSLKTSFDNNLGLTAYYQNKIAEANKHFDGSKRLASVNNRALVEISQGNYARGVAILDSLNKEFIRKNKVANSRVKNNLTLAKRKAPMDNNYKFITYYFLHQDKPEISETNPFQSQPLVRELPIDLKPDIEYILEYADIECDDLDKDRKKKKNSKPKLKFLKKKKSTDCPTFKT